MVTLPYFSLDYNAGFIAGSSKPEHADVHIDDNSTRHTQMVGAKD